MLATQTSDGDLRVWSVVKPPSSDQPRVIRVLRRSDEFFPGRNWIAWSKNGRIIQFSEGYVKLSSLEAPMTDYGAVRRGRGMFELST